MFILPIACFISGCISDIDYTRFDNFSSNPPKEIIREFRRQNPDKSKPNNACYVMGEFYSSCPNNSYDAVWDSL